MSVGYRTPFQLDCQVRDTKNENCYVKSYSIFFFGLEHARNVKIKDRAVNKGKR